MADAVKSAIESADEGAPPADGASPAAAAPNATESASESAEEGAPPDGAPNDAVVATATTKKEPVFQMKLEPSDYINFKTDKFPPDENYAVEVKITNSTNQLQCYKIKCTSNEIFRVRPPLGYVRAGETFVVKFALIAKALPDMSKHFFAFYHVGVADDAKTPRQVWTPTTKPDGVIRVPVKFSKADGSPWPPAETAAAAGVAAAAAGSPADGASPAAAAPAN